MDTQTSPLQLQQQQPTATTQQDATLCSTQPSSSPSSYVNLHVMSGSPSTRDPCSATLASPSSIVLSHAATTNHQHAHQQHQTNNTPPHIHTHHAHTPPITPEPCASPSPLIPPPPLAMSGSPALVSAPPSPSNSSQSHFNAPKHIQQAPSSYHGKVDFEAAFFEKFQPPPSAALSAAATRAHEQSTPRQPLKNQSQLHQRKFTNMHTTIIDQPNNMFPRLPSLSARHPFYPTFRFLAHPITQFTLLILLIISLFAHDFTVAFLNKDMDLGKSIVQCIIFLLLCMECLLCCVCQHDYVPSLYMLVDVISAITLMFDVQFFQLQPYQATKYLAWVRICKIGRIARDLWRRHELKSIPLHQRDNTGVRMRERIEMQIMLLMLCVCIVCPLLQYNYHNHLAASVAAGLHLIDSLTDPASVASLSQQLLQQSPQIFFLKIHNQVMHNQLAKYDQLRSYEFEMMTVNNSMLFVDYRDIIYWSSCYYICLTVFVFVVYVVFTFALHSDLSRFFLTPFFTFIQHITNAHQRKYATARNKEQKKEDSTHQEEVEHMEKMLKEITHIFQFPSLSFLSSSSSSSSSYHAPSATLVHPLCSDHSELPVCDDALDDDSLAAQIKCFTQHKHEHSSQIVDLEAFPELASVENIMQNQLLAKHFKLYLTANLTQENYMFFQDCNSFRTGMKLQVLNIYNTYISPKAAHQVNISTGQRDSIVASLDSPYLEMFDEALQEALLLMKGHYQAFIASKYCKHYMEKKRAAHDTLHGESLVTSQASSHPHDLSINVPILDDQYSRKVSSTRAQRKSLTIQQPLGDIQEQNSIVLHSQPSVAPAPSPSPSHTAHSPGVDMRIPHHHRARSDVSQRMLITPPKLDTFMQREDSVKSPHSISHTHSPNTPGHRRQSSNPIIPLHLSSLTNMFHDRPNEAALDNTIQSIIATEITNENYRTQITRTNTLRRQSTTASPLHRHSTQHFTFNSHGSTPPKSSAPPPASDIIMVPNSVRSWNLNTGPLTPLTPPAQPSQAPPAISTAFSTSLDGGQRAHVRAFSVSSSSSSHHDVALSTLSSTHGEHAAHTARANQRATTTLLEIKTTTINQTRPSISSQSTSINK